MVYHTQYLGILKDSLLSTYLLLILGSEKNLFVSTLVYSILESSLPTSWNKDQDVGIPTWYSTSLQPLICGFLLYVPKTVLK